MTHRQHDLAALDAAYAIPERPGQLTADDYRDERERYDVESEPEPKRWDYSEEMGCQRQS